MVESVDTPDLKSCGPKARAGSTPAPGTTPSKQGKQTTNKTADYQRFLCFRAVRFSVTLTLFYCYFLPSFTTYLYVYQRNTRDKQQQIQGMAIKIRKKALSTGKLSLYLDNWDGEQQQYEFLKLYLYPR